MEEKSSKKSYIILIIILVMIIIALIAYIAYDYKKDLNNANAIEYVESETEESIKEVEEAAEEIDVEFLSDEGKIEHTLFTLFKKTYGDKLDSAKIYINKIYTSEELEKNPIMKSLNLKEDEIAFEATISFLPVEDADPIEFMIPNGEYDEDSGWITDVTRVGVLTPTKSGKEKYEITYFGTGW